MCVCAEWTAEVRIRKRGQASENGGPVDYIAIPFFLSFLPSLFILYPSSRPPLIGPLIADDDDG